MKKIILKSLEEKVKVWNQAQNDNATVSPIEGGFSITLGMFHYEFENKPELIVVELEVSNDAHCKSVRLDFCENGPSTDQWDTIYLSPRKVSLLDAMEHVISAHNGWEPTHLSFNFIELKAIEKKWAQKIAFMTQDLKLIRHYKSTLNPA